MGRLVSWRYALGTFSSMTSHTTSTLVAMPLSKLIKISTSSGGIS